MKFKYRYVPVWPAAFTELHHGIEALVHRFDGSHDADGVSVELHPGDFIESDEPILGGGDSTDTHPHLEPVESIPDALAEPAPAIVAAPEIAAQPPTDEPPAEHPDADNQES